LAWAIDYTATAKRQLQKLDKHTARRILDFMDKRVSLLEDPRSVGKALRGPLGDFWRYRIGDCRVICDIQDSAVRVLVVRVGNRKEIYR
jgi:mRNA interferase RelE/StbE